MEIPKIENYIKKDPSELTTGEILISYQKYAKALEKYIKEQLIIHDVVKSLPTKKYEIDFGGNVLAGLEITNNEPIVIGAMNGWGNGISKDEITITEK